MTRFSGKEWRPDVENGLAGTVGEGESGTNGESSRHIFTIVCKGDLPDPGIDRVACTAGRFFTI